MAGDRGVPERGAGSWVAIGVVFAAMNGAYQCLAARLISSLFPLHVAAMIPLMLGLSIASAGIGALLSRKLAPRLGLVGMVAAAGVVAATCAQFAIGAAVSRFWFMEGAIAAVATTIPAFAAMGAVTAACFAGLAAAAPSRIPRLLALEGVAFVIAYTGAAVVVGAVGIIGPLLATAAGGWAARTRRGRGALVLAAAAIALLPVDAGDNVFNAVRPSLRLWDGFTDDAHLGGGWSPYARIDLVRAESGMIAGVYNGSQQWAVDPSGTRDFDIRTHLYSRLGGEVLVIGTGGGQGVSRLPAAVSRVVAVELDPLVVRLASVEQAAQLGSPYRRAEVIAGDGRTYLDQSREMFDCIVYEGADLNVAHRERELIGMESFLYTAEGIAMAFDRLKGDGALVFLLSAGRGFASSVASGCGSAARTLVYEGNAEGIIPFRYQLVIASRSGQVIAGWREHLSRGCLDIRLLSSEETDALGREIAADDRPFVYGAPAFLAPLLVTAITVLALGLLVLVLRSRPRRETAYFALVGAAFVFAEIGALVVSRAALGGYFTTSSAVFAFIAAGYAAGTLVSSRLGRPAIAGLTVLAFGVGFATIVVSPGGFGMLPALLGIAGRTLPLGFVMGLYLPKGFAVTRPERVPRLVAADIIGGALGTLGYYAVMYWLGTKAAWLGGAGIYLAALALL